MLRQGKTANIYVFIEDTSLGIVGECLSSVLLVTGYSSYPFVVQTLLPLLLLLVFSVVRALSTIFNERKLVLGTPDVKVKVKVKPPKSFGTVKYC